MIIPRKFKLSFWIRIIIILCGLLGNAIIINNYRNLRSDFVQDYIAANSLRRGGSIYGEDIVKFEKELVGFGDIQNFHPPFNALLFFPLSFLKYQTAYIILSVTSILILVLINQLVIKGLGLNKEWFLNITCFTLFWYPVLYCIGTGQSSMIIAFCLIGGWYYLHSEKICVAGFLFSIATLIKLFPGLVLLYLLLMKKWRALFLTVFFIVFGLTATAFIVGLEDMKTYSIIMVARDIKEWRGFVLNHSVGGMITKIFSCRSAWTEPIIELPRASSLLIYFLDATILIYAIMKMKTMVAQQDLIDCAFGLTIATMLLLSPITWGHIFPVLILPISFLLKEYICDPSPRKLRVLLFIVFLLSLPDVLIARGLMAINYPFRMPWYYMLFTLAPGLGVMLLWIVLSRRGRIISC